MEQKESKSLKELISKIEKLDKQNIMVKFESQNAQSNMDLKAELGLTLDKLESAYLKNEKLTRDKDRLEFKLNESLVRNEKLIERSNYDEKIQDIIIRKDTQIRQL